MGNRKIGLGIMGFADALILLGIRYDSDQAIEFARQLGQFIQKYAHHASQQLAVKRGNFPNWKGSISFSHLSLSAFLHVSYSPSNFTAKGICFSGNKCFQVPSQAAIPFSKIALQKLSPSKLLSPTLTLMNLQS